MPVDPNLPADDQDGAETFDETNITRDGDDIAHPDMARDVYDVTSLASDADEDETSVNDNDGDLSEAEADELGEEISEMRNDSVGEHRSFLTDAADRVSDADAQPADYEGTNTDIEALGYDDDRKPAEHDPHVERQLDHGLDETFPASDPVSINPGAD